MLSPLSTSNSPSPQTPLALLRQTHRFPAGRTGSEALSLAFLRRVAADDQLRAELERDPVATLTRYGIHLDPKSVTAHVSLPASEAIQEALQTHCDDESLTRVLRYNGFFGGLDTDE